jgi:hypothetical protein
MGEAHSYDVPAGSPLRSASAYAMSHLCTWCGRDMSGVDPRLRGFVCTLMPQDVFASPRTVCSSSCAAALHGWAGRGGPVPTPLTIAERDAWYDPPPWRSEIGRKT